MAASPKVRSQTVGIDPPSLVKNLTLLKERRQAVVKAAVKLFTVHGFHKTTTRNIAREAGIGVGSLYDYVRSKEDILFLVTEHIHSQVEERLKATLDSSVDPEAALTGAMTAYFAVCDDLADDILLIYQESKSLPPDSRRSMLERESRISGFFREIIKRGVEEGCFSVQDGSARLLAEDIVVLGHMWTFRRWRLPKRFDLGEYTRLQTGFIMDGLRASGPGSNWIPGTEDSPNLEGNSSKENPGLEDLLISLRNF